ncbi:MAG: hypothetical protein G01um10143_165 [Parcubacteria group bacterium Gr01-1014_3]|nr:MAG: hypothetical protein G01um10143_165 [Parcubacteria group bacterium Gr01-1014_3]
MNTTKILLISFFIIGVVSIPVLIGAYVMGTDSVELNIPQMTFYKNAITKSESPFWNPYIATGFPNFISIGGFPFAPIYLFLYILPAATVHYWGLWLTLSLACLFFILFMRELDIGIWPSFIGAFAYFAGNIHFARDLVLGTALFIQPALFLILIKIYKSDSTKKRALLIFLGGLLIGYGWLMSSYFPILYIASAAFSFVLFLGWRDRYKKIFPRILSAFFLIFLIGTGIGLLQLVPTYVMTQFSQRSGGFAHEGYAILPEQLLNFFHLTSSRGLDAYLYPGMVPLIFLILSFWVKREMIGFFRGVFLIAVVLSIHGSPLFQLLSHLPIFNLFQGAARFMLIGTFAAAVLVGYGSSYFMSFFEQNKKKATGLLCLIGVGISIFLLLALGVFKNQDTLFSVMISAIILAIALAIALDYPFSFRSHKVLALCILAFLEFIVIFYRFNISTIVSRSFYEKDPPTAAFLRETRERVLPLFTDDWDDLFFSIFHPGYTPPKDDFLYNSSFNLPTYRPNFQLLYGVENLEANEPLLNVEMGRLMALVGTRQLVTTGGEKKLDKTYIIKDNRDFSIIEKYRLLASRLPLADFLGIRYFMTFLPFDHNDFAPKIDLPRIGEWSLNLRVGDDDIAHIPIAIYNNPTAKPLVYFANITDFKSDPSEIYRSFKASGFRDIIVECSVSPRIIFPAGEPSLTTKKCQCIKLTLSFREFLFPPAFIV